MPWCPKCDGDFPLASNVPGQTVFHCCKCYSLSECPNAVSKEEYFHAKKELVISSLLKEGPKKGFIGWMISAAPIVIAVIIVIVIFIETLNRGLAVLIGMAVAGGGSVLAWKLSEPRNERLKVQHNAWLKELRAMQFSDSNYERLRTKLIPDGTGPYVNPGEATSETSEYERAIADYSKVIELNPDDTDAYYNRGCTYGEMREYDKAIADFSKVIEMDPSNADTYYNRGVVYSEKGEVDKAAGDLKKCVELSTDRELTKAAEQELHKIG